jgi:hypothetical protein
MTERENIEYLTEKLNLSEEKLNSLISGLLECIAMDDIENESDLLKVLAMSIMAVE